MVTSDPSFCCNSCGKTYRWKPEMAGKAARCGCGNVVQVPMQPPPLPVSAMAVDAPRPKPVIAYQPKPAAVLPAKDASDVRDIHVPTALLVAGGVALLVWVVTQERLRTHEAIVIFQVISVLIFIKVGVLMLLAWYWSRKSNGYFGDPLSTILKIWAMVVALDAVFLWSRVVMRDTGMISTSGRGPVGTILLELLVMLFTGLFIARFVYQQDDHEATVFGCLIALGNVAVNIAMVLALILGVHLLIAARMKPAVAISSPSAGTASTGMAPTSAGPTGNVPVNNAVDRAIGARISRGSPLVLSGNDWIASPLSWGAKSVVQLIGQMNAAGARGVYVETASGRTGLTGHKLPAAVYVELPSDPALRGQCLQQAKLFLVMNGFPAVFLTAPGKYLVIDLQR